MRGTHHGRPGETLRDAAANHPGATAGLGLLTTPLAMRAANIALRWARRNPALAFVVGVGALAWWARRTLREQSGAAPRGQTYEGETVSAEDAYDFPGSAHGSIDGHEGRPGRRTAEERDPPR